MNYFTPEYIALCNNKEIQGLRPNIKMYDHISPVEKPNPERADADFKEDIDFFINKRRNNYIFLPNGDQLDEEIVKICEKNFGFLNWNYETTCGFNYEKEIQYYALITDNNDRPIVGDLMTPSFNPLITKIKLLKQLIEKEKWSRQEFQDFTDETYVSEGTL